MTMKTLAGRPSLSMGTLAELSAVVLEEFPAAFGVVPLLGGMTTGPWGLNGRLVAGIEDEAGEEPIGAGALFVAGAAPAPRTWSGIGLVRRAPPSWRGMSKAGMV